MARRPATAKVVIATRASALTCTVSAAKRKSVAAMRAMTAVTSTSAHRAKREHQPRSCARPRGVSGAKYAAARRIAFRYGHAPAAKTITSAVRYAPPSHAFATE